MSLDPRQPSVTGPADPEHDPAASYALEPSAVRALTDRIVSTTGRSEPSYTPITGQPLAQVPQSSEADVEEAFARARRAQRAWAQTSLDERAARLQPRRTFVEAGLRPGTLRPARPRERLLDVGLAALRHLREGLAGDRGVRRLAAPGRRHDPVGERPHRRRLERVGRRRVVLRVRGSCDGGLARVEAHVSESK